MKVILDSIIYWLQKDGGASRYWFELTSRLHINNIVDYEIIYSKNTNNKWHILGKKFQHCRRWTCILIDRYIYFNLFKIDENSIRVFHSSHYRVLKKKNIVNVVTVYDFIYEKHRSGLALWVHRWQKSYALRSADLIIAISNYTKQQLMEYYPHLKQKQIEVVHLGVGNEFYKIKDLSSNEDLSIVYVGNRDGYKRFDLCLDVIRLLDNACLKIVGGGLSYDEIEELNRQIPFKWTYMGRLTDSELNELYNKSFCLIFPSDSEGFGLPLLEAMRAGCPVICSNLGVFKEIAEDAVLYAMDQRPESYASAVLKLKDAFFREQIIRCGLSRSSQFSWEACYKKTLDCYELALQIRKARN